MKPLMSPEAPSAGEFDYDNDYDNDNDNEKFDASANIWRDEAFYGANEFAPTAPAEG